MDLSFAGFVLMIIIIAILLISLAVLVSEIIKRAKGRKKADKFTSVVDEIVDFLAGLV